MRRELILRVSDLAVGSDPEMFDETLAAVLAAASAHVIDGQILQIALGLWRRPTERCLGCNALRPNGLQDRLEALLEESAC
jgi:hypothetical protein